MQLTLISNHPERKRYFLSLRGTRLDEAFFYLKQYLKAGFSLSQSLTEVSRLEIDQRQRIAFRLLSRKVADGMLLSEAMAQTDIRFDSTLVAFIQAGERQGELADAFGHCEEILRWRNSMRNRLRQSLTYPCISLLSITALLLFLIQVVVPSFDAFLFNQNIHREWHTNLLFAVSDAINTLTDKLLSMVLLAGVLVIIVVKLVDRSPFNARENIALPIVSNIKVSLSLSYYCQHCALLYQAGIVLPESMAIGERVVPQKCIRQKLKQVRENLQAGVQLDESREVLDGLPDTFVRMWIAAEKSDDICRILDFCSEMLIHEAMGRVNRMLTLFGPIVFSLLGLTLVWIIVSLLLPVYQVAIDLVVY